MDIAAIARPEFRVLPVRFLSALPIAFAVTLALIYLMHRLVYIDAPVIDETPSRPIVDVVQIPTIIKNRYESTKPKKPEPPKEEPLPPETAIETPKNLTPIGNPNISYNPGNNLPTINLSGTDSVVQQVMVPPQYPRSALAKGTEGFVDVAFEVSALGVPQNVRVTRADPEGVFERSAVRAVKRWKYLPRDAQAAKAVTVHERIRFKISTP